MIYIGCDHGGFELKNHLKGFLSKNNYEFEDLGAHKYDKNDDYPDYALKVCEKVKKEKNSKGILICSSGQGMSIAANKIKGIRAVLCCNSKAAKCAAEHINANVLCLGAKFISKKNAEQAVKTWLETKFSNEKRHTRRINKIMKLEKGN